MTEPVVGGIGVENLLELDVDELLDALSGDDPVPGSGSAAALVVAMAAGLLNKAASRSGGRWTEAGGAVAQAHALRLRAAALAISDARVFQEAIDRLGQPAGDDFLLGVALEHAADIPLRIAQAGVDVTELAGEVAEHCEPAMRPDAVGAGLLAVAATRAAAHLVEVNLGATPDDVRVGAARELVRAAEGALVSVHGRS